MNDLTLFSVVERDNKQWISARKLHELLEVVGRDFSTWIKDRIEEYGFEERKSYSPVLGNRSDGKPGKQKTDYLLTISMAKELSMVENTSQGREMRRRLIKLEEAWNIPEAVTERARQMGIFPGNNPLMLPGAPTDRRIGSNQDGIGENKERRGQ
jgi:phage anti-repressor protein